MFSRFGIFNDDLLDEIAEYSRRVFLRLLPIAKPIVFEHLGVIMLVESLVDLNRLSCVALLVGLI
jgi:hypothetical protein